VRSNPARSALALVVIVVAVVSIDGGAGASNGPLALPAYQDPAKAAELQSLLLAQWPNPHSAAESGLGPTTPDRNVRSSLWRARMSAGYLPRLRAMLSLTLRPSSWTNGWWVKRFTQSGALFDQKWLYLTGDIGVVPAGSQYVTGYEWLFETATSRWIDQYRSYWGSPIGVWKLYFDPSICNNAASFWCFPNLYGVDRTAAYNTTREAWQNFDHAPGDTLAVPCQGSPYVPTAVTAQSCFIKVISESAMEGRITNERFETYTTQTVNSLTNHTLNYDSVGAQQSFNSTAESRGADWVNRRLDPTSPWQPLFLTTTSGPGIHAGNKSREMGDPVNSALGAFVTEETDLAMPALGVPFQLRRVYSSASPAEGALGQGWSHSYSFLRKTQWRR